MGKFISGIKNFFHKLFEDEFQELEGDLEKLREKNDIGHDAAGDLEDTEDLMMDTDTAEIGSQAFRNAMSSLPPQEIDDGDYWWNFEGHPEEDVHFFDDVSPDLVIKELNRKIDSDEFPVIEIPSNIMKTMQLLNNPEFDFAEVARLIEHSPAMAGEFIKVINSSLYHRGVAISDLKLALPRMGKDSIKALLYLYSTKLSLASHPLFNNLAVEIVDHSYAVALIASYLSQRFYPDPDSAFLAGLLHDVGKLGVLKALTVTCKLPRKLDYELKEESMDRIFDELHERAGSFLAENWKIHKTVVAAIEHHTDFMDFGFSEDNQVAFHLCALINLSDVIARILGKGKRIGRVNIFREPAAIELNIEKTHETVAFLDDIPDIVAFKTSSRDMAAG